MAWARQARIASHVMLSFVLRLRTGRGLTNGSGGREALHGCGLRNGLRIGP